MPYRRKRDGKWMAQVRIKGQRFDAPHPFDTKTEAKDWEADTRRGLLESPVTACGDLAEKYLDSCQLRYVKRTMDLKRLIFKRFFESIPPSTDLVSIQPAQASDHLSKVAQERTGYVANAHRTHLIAWWNWCAKFHGIRIVCPFLLVDKFPSAKVPRHMPSMNDFLRVLESVEGQDRVLLLTYLHTAARRCELYEMTWADVDFGRQRVRLWTRKTKGNGRREDWLDMTDELSHVLLAWRRENQNSILVFHRDDIPYTTRHEWLPKLCRKVGVTPFNYHGIRHLTASYLADANVPMKMIQGILRHRHLNITDAYIGQLGSQKKVLEILPFTTKPTTGRQANKKVKGDK